VLSREARLDLAVQARIVLYEVKTFEAPKGMLAYAPVQHAVYWGATICHPDDLDKFDPVRGARAALRRMYGFARRGAVLSRLAGVTARTGVEALMAAWALEQILHSSGDLPWAHGKIELLGEVEP